MGLLAGDFSVCEPSTPSGTGALQDLAGVQVPLLAGVVSLLIGDALQDRFAVFAPEIVERGKSVLSSSIARASRLWQYVLLTTSNRNSRQCPSNDSPMPDAFDKDRP